MSENANPIEIDLSNLFAIAGGDNMFVVALLGKMCKALPEAYTNMENFVAAKDWSGLKSAAHKAKSTFAYLSLDDMKNRLKDIEHNAMDGTNLDDLPRQVEEACTIGRQVLAQLQAKLAELM